MLSYELAHSGDGQSASALPSQAQPHYAQYQQQQQQHALHSQYSAQHQHQLQQHQQHLALMQQLSFHPSVLSLIQQQRGSSGHPSPHSSSASAPSSSSSLVSSLHPSQQQQLQPHQHQHPQQQQQQRVHAPAAAGSPPLRSVVVTKAGESLAAELNRRRSRSELAMKGIMFDTAKAGQPSVRVQQTQRALRRQQERDRLSAFIANRPTLQELSRAKHNLILDTMTWTRLAMQEPVPTPRNCHTMTHIAPSAAAAAAAPSPSLGLLYLLGGYGTGQQSSELLCLSLDAASGPVWSRPAVGGAVPCERYSHSCSAYGSKLLLFGGLSASANGTWLNDFHILDTEPQPRSASPLLSWYAPSTGGCPPPCPRAAHSAVVVGHSLLVFAGNDGKQLFNDLYALDLDSLCWHQPAQHGDVPSPRAGHTCNLLPDSQRLIVFGGGNAHGPTNDLHVLDCRSFTWTRPPAFGTPPSPRAGHTACVLSGNELLVFGGGYLNKVHNDLHVFNADTSVWSRPSDTGDLPIPRAGHSSSVIGGNRIVVFAGGDAEDVFNDLHLLDTSFFRMMEQQQAAGGGGQDDDGADEEGQHRAPSVPHSMSAPSSPSSHARRSLSSEQQQQQHGRADGGEWESDGGQLWSRLDDCASQLSSVVSASLQRLEYRQRQAESEEAELLRLLQAVRDRRLADYRQTADDVAQLQALIMTSISDIKDDVSRCYRSRSSAAFAGGETEQETRAAALAAADAAVAASSSSAATSTPAPPAPPPPLGIAASSLPSTAAAAARPKKSPRKRSGKAAAAQQQQSSSSSAVTASAAATHNGGAAAAGR